MLITAILSLFITGAFLYLGYFIPEWLTEDTTLQAMLTELLPLIALGNVTMNVGMVCWTLVGAQGRYNLATSIATACSFLITIPLGAVFTFWLNINLQGLVFAVVVGYVITSMILSTVLLVSDWEMISTKIQNKRAEEAKKLKKEVIEEDEGTIDTESKSSKSPQAIEETEVRFKIISIVTYDQEDEYHLHET